MRTILCWSAAAALMVLCYATRFDILARDYLASAYVIRNLAIELAAAGLIVVGLPTRIAARIHVPLAVGWPAGMIAMAVWYAPSLLTAAVNSRPILLLQAVTWVLGGILLLLPVYSPAPERRVKPMPHGVTYMLTALVFSSLLSVFVGFTHFGLYTPFLDSRDTLHILDQLQGRFGLTPEADQQTASLLLWVLSCFVWLSTVMYLFWRMYKTPEPER